jgi:hypothetical protein
VKLILTLGFVCGLAACAMTPTSNASPIPAPLAPLRWWVTVDDDLSLHARICRVDGSSLLPSDVKDIGPIASRARAFATAPSLVAGCLEVLVDLERAAAALDDRSDAKRLASGVVVASPDVWLWTRRGLVGGVLTMKTTSARVRAVVPFAPHPSLSDGDGSETFIVEESAWRRLSQAVFGDVSVRRLDDAGSRFTLVTLPGERQMRDDDVDRWIRAAIVAVVAGAGPRARLPFERATIVVEVVAGDGVPFGMVARGGGLQVWLSLGDRARLDEVINDWVAVHELSHLLQPLVGVEEAWFGEGLATWHQVVLRARVGLVTEAQAWALLRDGFTRGATSAADGVRLPLHAASARMRRDGRFLQTYWGGAALIFAVDVALRHCAALSIDDVLAEVMVHRTASERLSARSILHRAANAAPACAHITEDVDAMLREPFPKAGLALLVAEGAHDSGKVSPLSAIMRPRAVRP